MDSTPINENKRRISESISDVQTTPKVRKVKGTINIRNLNFTAVTRTTPKSSCSSSMAVDRDFEFERSPQPFTPDSQKASLPSIVTPVTAMVSDVRERLNIFDAPLTENELLTKCLTELKSIKELPNCLCAIGYLFKESVHLEKTQSSVLDRMPKFLGYYKGPSCKKSFARMRKKLSSLEEEFVSLTKSRLESSLEQHLSIKEFVKDAACEICLQNDNSITDIELKSFVTTLYESRLKSGQSSLEVHTLLSKLNNNAFDEFNLVSENLPDPVAKNLEIFQKNIDEQSALLYFATPIPNNQIVSLDRKLYCKPKKVHKTVDEIIALLPNVQIKNIQSSILELDFKLLLLEYEKHIIQFGTEQNTFFQSLGEKYQILGSRGGTSRPRIYAQAIVLHHIKKLENRDQDRFNRLFSAFEIGFRRRAKLEQFELSGKYKFPRFPSKKSAIAEMNRLVKEKIILIGQSQLAETITATHHITGEKFETNLELRKVTFDELREFTLHKHEKYLRAKKPSYYSTLTKATILQMFKEYGILNSSHQNLEEKELQKLVRKYETTREIAIWYDHATIANRSHVQFTFQIIYNTATYVCPPGMDKDDMQKEIETPQIYVLGLSKSTT